MSSKREQASLCDPMNQFENNTPGLQTYPAWVVPNGMPPTQRCSAPGCGAKIKDKTMIAIRHTDGVEYIHEMCVYEYERGFDDRIPARGLLLFEEDL